jgi:hypothetical protein
MSVVAQRAASSGMQPAAGSTFRSLLEGRRSQGQRVSLDDAIAVIVPVCTDLKERHARGEKVWVHPSAIAKGPDGLMRIHPPLAVPPKDPRDRAALAPEVVRSNAPGNARASVFAVGAMLYEALTGSPVGPGMRRPREVDPSLPEALEHLLAKALVADPAHRPDDLGALASAMHHLAPMKSIPPPSADESRLDQGDGQPVDIKLSLMPPVDIAFSAPPPMSQPGIPGVQMPGQPAVPRDPTRALAQLKARLESDPRPRYVVNKDRMDHGPFNAVELLQQIASHLFKGEHILRDELTGVSKTIDEWDEFAPFAQHARMHRDIAQEKKEVSLVESREKKAGAAKFIVGGLLACTLLGVGGWFVYKQVGSRRGSGDVGDDPSALDLSGGGSLKGGKKGAGHGGKGGAGGGGGGFAGGMSYEGAIAANNQEINMGGPKGGPDLSDGQLSAPMRNAAFISGCGAPNDMKVTVRVAVKMGRAVGVSVYTNPANPQVAGCVDRHVRALSWPANPKMDSFTTTY